MSEDKDSQLNQFKGLETLLEDISTMMMRWKAGSMIKHMDLELFERVVHERFELERQLMIASETIQVLSEKAHKNDIILKHFTEEDAEVMRKRIGARLAREANESREEMHEVSDN